MYMILYTSSSDLNALNEISDTTCVHHPIKKYLSLICPKPLPENMSKF